jgi:hypothetical protein
VKVSKNELKASLHKAFEGLGFHSGDYHNAADMVIWLETHGFYGFDRLLAALSYLNTTAPVHADLSHDDGYNFVLDGKGTSILLCGSEAVDLLRAASKADSGAGLELINCYNRTFIIQRLVKSAERNVACVAYWRQLDYCVKVSVEAGDFLPEYKTFSLIEEFDAQSLRIFSGPSLGIIENQFKQYLKFGSLIDTYESVKMEDCYRNSLEHGVEIDEALWKTLDDLVARVLVESTELSRAGAGD